MKLSSFESRLLYDLVSRKELQWLDTKELSDDGIRKFFTLKRRLRFWLQETRIKFTRWLLGVKDDPVPFK